MASYLGHAWSSYHVQQLCLLQLCQGGEGVGVLAPLQPAQQLAHLGRLSVRPHPAQQSAHHQVGSRLWKVVEWQGCSSQAASELQNDGWAWS